MIVKPKVQAWNKSSNNTTTNKNQPKLTSYVIKHKNGLTSAVKRSCAKVVKRLIENKLAKVRGEDTFFTLLREVAARNILDVVKHLTKSEMGIEIKDQSGFTPLHVVAARNSAKSIKYLLKNGANLEAQDNSGCTPLHCAVMSNRVKGVKCLVESGANLEARDNDGCTPLLFAECRQSKKIIKLLQEKTESKKDLDRDVLKETKSQHSDYVAKHEAQLEALKKQNREENKSLKQKIENLESENATLNSELEKNKNQRSQISEVSLKKVEKKPPSSKIAYASLVVTSVVGSILSIVSQLFVLSIVTASATAALIAIGITYAISKPATELKEVDIQSSVQHDVGKRPVSSFDF